MEASCGPPRPSLEALYSVYAAERKVINRQAVHDAGEPQQDIALDASRSPAFEGNQ
jgi:hypothetical protein